jgi:hypothetical protein
MIVACSIGAGNVKGRALLVTIGAGETEFVANLTGALLTAEMTGIAAIAAGTVVAKTLEARSNPVASYCVVGCSTGAGNSAVCREV